MIFTVVGHGQSPLGLRLGSYVDQHPVIRMHNRHWQSREDYGTRTDYTVIPGPWAARESNPKFNRMFSEKAKPSVAWVAYTLRPRALVHTHIGIPVTWFDYAWFVEMLKPDRKGVLDVVPTRGAAAILMAMDLGATHIRTLGCDSLMSGIITDYAPGAGRLRDPRWLGKAFNVRHDFERERDALNEVALKRQIKLEAFLSAEIAA